jgi:acylglycerol lipase
MISVGLAIACIRLFFRDVCVAFRSVPNGSRWTGQARHDTPQSMFFNVSEHRLVSPGGSRPALGARVGAAVAILAVLAILAACAPRVQSALNAHQPPRLTETHAVMRDGAGLPLTRWLPKRPPVAAVVALHGFNDHSGAFADLGPALARAGVAVYAYDQRGFGGAPGRGIWAGAAAMGRDLAEITRLVRAAHPGVPVHALGESMGGAVIMAALAGAGRPAVDGAVLSAPAVWGRATMARWQRGVLDAAAAMVPAIRLRPQGIKITPSDNIEMLRALGRDPRFIRETRIDALDGLVGLMDRALAAAGTLRRPLLVLYGERDEIVPRIPTCLMLSRLPVPGAGRRWRAALYPRGYHMLFRDLAGDRVTQDIAAWLVDPAAALPSGHERLPDPATGNPLPGFCPEPASRR